MLIRDCMIVLKNQPFSESDLIIRGLNKKGCQISCIAKGALKSKNRFCGGVLHPTSYIEFEYRPFKSALHLLQQAWFLEDFSLLRKDYQRLELALYFLKIMQEISQEGSSQDSSELFHLLGNALTLTGKSSELDSLKLFFQVKILFLQGVLPTHLTLPEVLKKTLNQHENLTMDKEKKTYLLGQLDRSLRQYLSM